MAWKVSLVGSGFSFVRLGREFFLYSDFLLLFLRLRWRRFVRGVVKQNARACVAGLNVAAHLELVVLLRAQHHVASRALLVPRLGERRAACPDHAIIVREHGLGYLGPQFVPFARPFRQGL